MADLPSDTAYIRGVFPSLSPTFRSGQPLASILSNAIRSPNATALFTLVYDKKESQCSISCYQYKERTFSAKQTERPVQNKVIRAYLT